MQTNPTPKIVFLDTINLKSCNLSRLDEFPISYYEFLDGDALIKEARDANILITVKVVIDKEIIDALKGLRLICVAATGVDKIDVEYAKKKGIEVKNVKEYSTASVAQHALTLTLGLNANLLYFNEYVKSGRYGNSRSFTCFEKPVFELAKKRWGTVGYGSIGKYTSSLAAAFGCEMVHYTRHAKKDVLSRHLPLHELVQTSDIISIHAPLNRESYHLFDAKLIQKLKPNAILINVARGGIVDEGALAARMREDDGNTICYGADVFEQEPPKNGSPIFDEDLRYRVLVTPHMAWGYEGSLVRLMDGVYENLRSFLDK